MRYAERVLILGLAVTLSLLGAGWQLAQADGVLAAGQQARRPQNDPPERTPGPVRFMLEVEALDPDGSHVVLDAGTFDTQAQAVTEVERITRDGVCVPPPDPPDPGLAALCYPPARHLRTRILPVVF